jgi:hypothetical protein
LDSPEVRAGDRVLEVRRVPFASGDTPLEYPHQETRTFTESDCIATVAAPNVTVSVADLLP